MGLKSATALRGAQPTRPYLSATLPVAALAAGSVAALCSAVDRYRTARELESAPWTLDLARIAASFSGDKMLRIDGAPVNGFAELSGFFPTSDGWVRTHANYPHHRARLLATLDLPRNASRDDLSAELARREGAAVEHEVTSAGGLAVRVRTEQDWAASEPGRRAASGPVVSRTMRPDFRDPYGPPQATSRTPLAGIRVLDLTRVIAGPVATRALALLGATVLRVDSPHLPEIAWQHIENGQGKRTTLLDLGEPNDRERFDALMSGVDVVVTGYRPGALDIRLAPGVVHGRVSAWGERGPWAHRRGFDSLVQAASGISLIEGAPGALPAQALDHASGYLLAAGVVDALAAQLADGIGRDATVSLARTAAWLLAAPGRIEDPPAAVLPDEQTVSTHGTITAARPALADYDDYPFPAHDWGSDDARW
ncbi:CoA transferase [Rhodococcoides trifolii]|uniref:CoA transferase n=1 Tax=Rhodococcoides trifolii TaxID=908250 RepID=UPI001662AF61|nr:CoA transferase [Rhodococcus trifolii]